MKLFEEIYREARLLRLQEAKALNSIEEIYKALKKDASGRRYIETLLNGKKNLPEWFRTLADYDNLDLIKQPLEALLSHFKNDQKGNVNYAICLLFRKSDSIDKLKEILKNSMDTLVQYANNVRTNWIKDLASYNDVMTQDYNEELWKKFEKEIQDSSTKKDAAKGKKLSKEDKAILYDTLYEDSNWGLYVPKSFEGDSELASHIKEFQNGSKTYNKTQWCTAANPDYFDYYSEDGDEPLYVIKYFENGVYTEAWQIAFMNKHIELMDKKDERNFDFLFKNAPMELFNKIIDKPKETESFIFPFLVKKYNNSTDNFDLDNTYSVLSELSTVSDDVKSMIGKDISLDELIYFRSKISSDSLEELIKVLANLKNKGYSLEFIKNAIGALGLIDNFESLEECIDLMKGNFSLEELEELKNYKESRDYKESGVYFHYRFRLIYDDLKTLIRLKEKGYSIKYIASALDLICLKDLEICFDLMKGNFSLEELKEFWESMDYGSKDDIFTPVYLTPVYLRTLIRLKEKGYSLKYLSDARITLGLNDLLSLEKCLDTIKGNFSLEELEELKDSTEYYNRYGFTTMDLEALLRLKEKEYSLKYIIYANNALGKGTLESLEKCLDIIKGNFSLEELKDFKESIEYYNYYGLHPRDLETLLRLKEKGYSLKYIIYANNALGKGTLESLEKCLDIIKGNFSLEELKEFKDSMDYYNRDGYSLNPDDLKMLIRLKEKHFSLKSISDILSGDRFKSIKELGKFFQI